MKVGILTFHFANNCGAVVQAWALQTYLRGLGHDVRIINYDPRVRRFPWWVHALRKSWKSYLMEYRFRRFRKRYLKETEKVTSPDHFPELGLDAYIVGSDQVWNLDFFKDHVGHFNRGYFLPVVACKAKRVAYACSVGEGGWNKDCAELTELLGRFDAVSVREKFAQKIVGACVEKSVGLVPDPTLLVKREAYLDQFVQIRPSRKMFTIFVYGLNAADRCCKILTELRKMHSDAMVRMVKLGTPIALPDELRIVQLSPDPGRWVSEIANADVVVTDSFHGVAVSIALGKNFYTLLKREEPNAADRIKTLLGEVGLEDRIVDVSSEHVRLPPERIDYRAISNKVAAYRERGVRFLAEALGGVK